MIFGDFPRSTFRSDSAALVDHRGRMSRSKYDRRYYRFSCCFQVAVLVLYQFGTSCDRVATVCDSALAWDACTMRRIASCFSG